MGGKSRFRCVASRQTRATIAAGGRPRALEPVDGLRRLQHQHEHEQGHAGGDFHGNDHRKRKSRERQRERSERSFADGDEIEFCDADSEARLPRKSTRFHFPGTRTKSGRAEVEVFERNITGFAEFLEVLCEVFDVPDEHDDVIAGVEVLCARRRRPRPWSEPECCPGTFASNRAAGRPRPVPAPCSQGLPRSRKSSARWPTR